MAEFLRRKVVECEMLEAEKEKLRFEIAVKNSSDKND